MGIGNGLPFRRRTDDDFVVVSERDNRWSSTIALAVLDHAGLAPLHDRHTGVSRPQVDANNFCHVRFLYKFTPYQSPTSYGDEMGPIRIISSGPHPSPLPRAP